MDQPCKDCVYDDRMASLPGYPERYLIGYCREHGRAMATPVYAYNEGEPRRGYRRDFYGQMVERKDGLWEYVLNANLDTRPPHARGHGSSVPMAADVLRVMRDDDVDQDEAVRRLGGIP